MIFFSNDIAYVTQILFVFSINLYNFIVTDVYSLMYMMFSIVRKKSNFKIETIYCYVIEPWKQNL